MTAIFSPIDLIANYFQSYLPEPLYVDKATAIEKVTEDGRSLRFVIKQLRDDEDVVIAAVSREPSAFEFASPRVLMDKRVVLAIIRKRPFYYLEVKNRFGSDRDIILAAVSQIGWLLKDTPEEYRSDFEIALAAVKESAEAFNSVDDSLKHDLRGAFHRKDFTEEDHTGFVVQSVRANSHVIRYLPEKTRRLRAISIYTENPELFKRNKSYERYSFLVGVFQSMQ